ncbi:MAG TPA: glycosyltransferase [Thermoanaerobaculia bacterium]|nr:glycosyltransferase [Thermoanaerobaculia bacterium]
MQVSVVVATYNRARLLGATLEALAAQRVPAGFDWEIVVVDNASRDGTAELIRWFAKGSPVPVRAAFEPRQGVSHARNRGIAEARGAILAFTDDDVLPAADWVGGIPAAMDRWKAQGVGGRILPHWDVPPPRWLTESKRLRECLALMESEDSRLLSLPRRLPTIWGPNMAFRREVFEKTGGFDPQRGLVGGRLFRGEEVDLVERALGLGMPLAYDASLVVFHRIGADRMRRAYFRRLFYDNAEGAARIAASASSRAGLLAAPGGIYRTVVAGLPRWMVRRLLRKPQAFEAQLAWIESLGALSGYWKARRSEIADA